MNKLTKKEQFNLLFENWYMLDKVYADYAKTMGLSHTSLCVLTLISENTQNCTQKLLCEKTFQPKQAINIIVTSFYKDGLVVLKEMPDDRRNKTIHLTKKGQKFAEKVISKLNSAFLNALNEVDENDMLKCLETLKIFTNKFGENIS